MFKKILIIVLLIISFVVFYKINEINYDKILEIRKVLVEHPDWVPKKEVAKISSLGFQNLRADYYWIKTIQYIWSYAYHSQYKAYLYKILDLVTELNPYFETPYTTWMLLLPAYESRYEFITNDENKIHVDEAIEIWLKWIKNFCSEEKVDLVNSQNDLLKIWNNSEYKDPCKTYAIPFYLAYVYFFYKNDPLESAKYYKIATACSDAPEWTKSMTAIMLWKWWDREKSFFMFLGIANSIKWDNLVCDYFIGELEKVWNWIFQTNEIQLNWSLLSELEELRKKAFDDEDEAKNKEKIIYGNDCWNYISKTIRELNLEYIERWNDLYFAETWENSINAKQLFDEWYIDFLPVDFQWYTSDGYWIIYIFNSNTWNYDYTMGNY